MDVSSNVSNPSRDMVSRSWRYNIKRIMKDCFQSMIPLKLSALDDCGRNEMDSSGLL